MIKNLISKALRRNSIARGATLSLFWQGVRVVTLAIWVILLAKNLDASGYGLFAGIAGIGTAMGYLTGFGFGTLMLKRATNNPDLFDQLWSKAFKITIVTGFLNLLFFIFICNLLFISKASLITFSLIGISELILYPIMTTCSFAFATKSRLGWSASLPAIYAVSRLTWLFLFSEISLEKTIAAYAWYHFFATSLACCFVLYCIQKVLHPNIITTRTSSNEIKEALSFCASWFSSNSLNSIDKTVVLRVGGAEAAGIYGSAQRIASVFYQPIEALISASLPKLFKEGQKAGGLIKTLFLIILFYGVAASTLLFFLFDLIFSFLGQNFSSHANEMKWLSLIVPIYGFRLLYTNALMTINKIKEKILLETIGIFILILTNAVLVTAFGLNGTIYALMITELTIAVLAWLLLTTTKIKKIDILDPSTSR